MTVAKRAHFGADLAQVREGSVIVEEYDATCVVPPGVLTTLNDAGRIVLDMGG